ncbi:bifunctional homocysteine S-methyltransferase/5,10-methylenetetrahydrofolate reductase protein [Thalassoglobus neptunius]|uniref:Bifunctional homocysteine S-methyltransferase/5,10-methylenetetrahydrofolate reductase protein n=1 Tax=Thalassoglobus neptunius TaxID=1938619 RepID=A0A5C5X6D1_9PLAN|nr:homocysteine S-methyltransferase family protein [Thalassoglobus neptunius]TWT57823.1 bifunctional homocysteine S-methyltransferase/5,10-methylenetetrahydrofolate reductase protein [Thalassoglobus neptunius]
MSSYRNQLPQLNGETLLTDGGLESTLFFQDGFELPEYSAYLLLDDDEGVQHLTDYFRRFLAIADRFSLGFLLESVTWRANQDWAERIGYSSSQLDSVNQRAIEMLLQLRQENEKAGCPIVVSGCLGPRGDGYVVGSMMTSEQAAEYHEPQIRSLASGGTDMVTAMTLTYAEEAIGIALAGQSARVPVAISFTVETDGRLPSGQPLGEAIEQIDQETGSAPAYYMINCAHPTHFGPTLTGASDWRSRIGGLRANASKLSHEELDGSEELDSGNPEEFGQEHRQLLDSLDHNISVLGGCCGTDHRHIEALCQSVFASRLD